jgi:hypothetical protein
MVMKTVRLFEDCTEKNTRLHLNLLSYLHKSKHTIAEMILFSNNNDHLHKSQYRFSPICVIEMWP